MMNNMKQKPVVQNQNESVKSKGKTVEEAVANGLARLNLTESQVEIEVINQGSRGILGLGAEDAEVILTPKTAADPTPAASEPQVETAAPASDAGDTGLDPALAQRAEEVLRELLAKMSINGTVTSRLGTDLVEDDETPPMVLDITGSDLGLLIGRRGETLRALQFVTRQILNKEMGRWVPVVVDVESYLARRRKTLQQLAMRMADRVVFSGRRVSLEPMPPNERRIIHMQLRNHDKVYTESTGEGERRKVVILPK